jgi:replication factor A2
VLVLCVVIIVTHLTNLKSNSPETYVRVNGRLNSFSNRTTVVSHAIRPIQDFNEVTYHLLDTIDTHLKFVKPNAPGSTAMDIDSSSAKTTIVERINEIILQFDDSVEGGTIDSIVYKLKGLHTEKEVRETVEWLQNEGQCYTTVDDNHVKSCLPN